MKRPILLLVDDDASVVQALEAELAPKYGEAFRIEAFEHPQDVLRAIPRWQEERRPIAVAIVDQKMPGLTGIELIGRMKGETASEPKPAEPDTVGVRFDPVSRIRTVLLTGYGGPAIEQTARLAGVDRYREKPWNGRALSQDVAGLLNQYLQDLSEGSPHLFQELTSEESLRRLWPNLQTAAEQVELPPDPGLIPGSGGGMWSRGVQSEARGDEALRRFLRTDDRPDQGQLPLEALLACIRGNPTPEQQAELRTALLQSRSARRFFSQLLQDLGSLSDPEARRAFDQLSVPESVRRLARRRSGT